MNETEELVTDVLVSVPERIASYYEKIGIAEENIMRGLEYIGLDPTHFLFLVIIFLLGLLWFYTKMGMFKWGLIAVMILILIAMFI